MGTKRAVAEVVAETRNLSSNMKMRGQDYDRGKHLAFSGLYNVALPLVGGYIQRQQFGDLYDFLKETQGEFVFRVPNFEEE